MGGWGIPAFTDFIMKERTDPMRPLNMYMHSLAGVREDNEMFDEIRSVIGSIYLAPFRQPNVYSFISSPSIPSFIGVDDPTSGLRRNLRNLVK